MSQLSRLPVEVLIDSLLPQLTARDILALGATNSEYHALCNDDPFWKRKLAGDFNFSGSKTARTSDWKLIYRGISHPKIFVWGQGDSGRLGKVKGSQPYPIRLRIPGRRIVELAAGGWSYHALDSEGNLFVLGALDASMYHLRNDGFSVSNRVTNEPLRLEMPKPIRQVSCGRLFTMALDSLNQVWVFRSWGRPYHMVSPQFDCTTPDSTPLIIESGWSFCAVLTVSGDVLVWWPFGELEQAAYTEKMAEMDREGGNNAHANLEDKSIPCAIWQYRHNPTRLPPLPALPSLGDNETGEAKIVKIAGMDNCLVALTNKGHVVKFDGLGAVEAVARGSWTYLPHFSEVARLKEHAAFRSEGDSTGKLRPPKSLHITHISAHFLTFFAYSVGEESIVLKGDVDSTAETLAKIIPSLQYRSVISVVLGDYHFGALTSDGKLYTWGKYSKGALGLGDPRSIPSGQPGGYASDEAARRFPFEVPDVDVPTLVKFDHGTKGERYVFGATAAGWHMGALVIDSEAGVEEEKEDISSPKKEEEETPLPSGPGGFFHGLPVLPAAIRNQGLFRFGFAGRGR